MTNPYHQPEWQPFSYGGHIYDLSHLKPFEFSVIDSSKVTRKIAVSFSDHCFTRSVGPGDQSDIIFPGCSRNPGAFCTTRYANSLSLPGLIGTVRQHDVWMLSSENCAFIPTIDAAGNRHLYAIVFSLDPVKGLEADLHMRVRSAYPCEPDTIITYGKVRFSHLVRLRVNRQHPNRITSGVRKKPTLR